MRIIIAIALSVTGCSDPAGDQLDAPPASDGGRDSTVDSATADAPGAPISCGGTVCAAEQACSSGVCKFACVGSSVPGDYATIETAVNALAATGQDATICLGAVTYVEGVILIVDNGRHGKALRIVGESFDRSIINSELSVGVGWGSVTLQGVGVSVAGTALTSNFENGVLTVLASKLEGASGIQANQRQDLVVDGSEIVSTTGVGVGLFRNGTGVPLVARVQNSYFRSTDGYPVRTFLLNNATIELTLLNNTIVGGRIGLDLRGGTTALVANNIFTGTTSFAMYWESGAVVTRGHNALWANQTNYSGLASDGPGYVKTDCLLDLAGRIPTLRPGSPCRNAADSLVATARDFYGAVRGLPDIGAVEAP